VTEAERLNADPYAGRVSHAALQDTLRAQGESWYEIVTARCPHLFADTSVFISPAQLRQMRGVIAAVEQVVRLPGWNVASTPTPTLGETTSHSTKMKKTSAKSLVIPQRGGGNPATGVFYGYDFHLNSEGAHLIEINTNAGGAFLNALLLDSQRETGLPGEALAGDNPEAAFLDMFRNEWRQARGAAPLKTVAIVDEQPEAQYLYPEFLLAQAMFGRAGISACIVDPAALQSRADGLYCNGQRMELIYNRLTDFDLQLHPVLREADLAGSVVVTPNPAHYARYADKRNLVRLTDADGLRALGVAETDIAVLQAGIPHTFVVRAEQQQALWENRKSLFFKPNCGYGSRGAYRGEKLTRRVFGEMLQSDYVAQALAAPGERSVDDEVKLKYDVRCYVYDEKIQLIAARLYQGQTTNFRTPGGGFAQVRVVG